MILKLTYTEALHVFETLLMSPQSNYLDHETLIAKIRSSILESLEEVEDKQNIDSYKLWIENENQKINSLKTSLKEVKVAAKMKSTSKKKSK